MRIFLDIFMMFGTRLDGMLGLVRHGFDFVSGLGWRFELGYVFVFHGQTAPLIIYQGGEAGMTKLARTAPLAKQVCDKGDGVRYSKG
jgi:hypothetical protein